MYRQIARNKRFGILLIAVFCVVIVGLGLFTAWVVEDWWPFWLLMIFCPLYVWWQLSHATEHAAKAAGWVASTPDAEPRLHRIVETTAIRAGIPVPQIGVIEDAAPNAFAASLRPEKAVIGVTRGALELLDDSELEAVIAHEVAHIVNQDGRVTLTTFALVGSIAVVASGLLTTGWLLMNAAPRSLRNGSGVVFGMIGIGILILGSIFWLVATVLGPVISAAVSRKREFLADASGVELTRFPDGLVRALEKIAAHPAGVAGSTSRTAEVQALFIYAGGGASWVEKLLGTHPPVEERVERLRAMGSSF
jgi:heat shock protein HtpX